MKIIIVNCSTWKKMVWTVNCSIFSLWLSVGSSVQFYPTADISAPISDDLRWHPTAPLGHWHAQEMFEDESSAIQTDQGQHLVHMSGVLCFDKFLIDLLACHGFGWFILIYSFCMMMISQIHPFFDRSSGVRRLVCRHEPWRVRGGSIEGPCGCWRDNCRS